MSLDEILGGIFIELLSPVVKGIGVFFRWIFLSSKYSYDEIYAQKWNTWTGLLIIIALIVVLVYY